MGRNKYSAGNTRMTLKKKLVAYIREKFTQTWLKNQGDPARVVSLLERINPNALMIGFCRRFATYKRAHLLFTDLERLSKMVIMRMALSVYPCTMTAVLAVGWLDAT